MASQNLLPYLLLQFSLHTALFATTFASHPSIKNSEMYPSSCSENRTCDALLYHKNYGLPQQNVSSFYSVKSSQIKPITHGSVQDYLISVPCSCADVNGTRGYFYNTSYKVQLNDTFQDVSDRIYSGQAYLVGDEGSLIAGDTVPIYLLCGCVESDSQIVVTYTVEQHDTLTDIGTLLSAKTDGIQSMNSKLIHSAAYLDVGWVLFVPMEKNGIPAPNHGKRHQWAIIVGILSAVTLLSMIMLTIMLLRRKISKQKREEDLKLASKTMSSKKSFSLQKQYIYEENMEAFGSERPVIFPLEEIEEATNSFDETRKIGEGGYGCVYFGVLGGKEVAIKKMRSNKSKEFFAELKVLCKIHHINVVELLGFASGDDHLYLVYEYVQNGSLNDHLHDPLLKGHQPLSWTARTQIALDTAKGIEYIHDHTKSRYVHRDIKTSNILLDEGLRAKVADFGLVKLVGRSSDEDFFATRLVGTPGYLPPESVKELQVTPKTDVFAFGVVLAELITGQRALIRDNREPSKLRSLITVVNKIFQDANPEAALEAVIDPNLKGSYPLDDVYKMAEIADWCLSDDAVSRPEMQEVVVALCQITMSSTEWEASLGGSQVFSGVFRGR